MFKKIKILLVVLHFTLVLTALPVAASTLDTINDGFSKTVTSAGFPTSETENNKIPEFSEVAIKYINTSLGFVGLLFMVLIIYAGYLWMTARGNEEQVKKGKTLMIQATVGLLIVLGARIITELILQYFINENA